MAAAGLQPCRTDGAGAADAAWPHADPAIRHAADPRRAAHRARRHGAAAFAPSGVAGDHRADAAGAADRGGDRRRRFGEEGRRVARVALAATVAAALAIGGARLVAPIEQSRRRRRRRSPRSRRSRRSSRRKPVLNDYAFGGYLIWSHVRPFIDGRADMYGDAMLGLYGKLQAGDDAAPSRTRSSAMTSPGRSSLPTAASSQSSTASPAGDASMPTRPRSCMCATGRPRRRD